MTDLTKDTYERAVIGWEQVKDVALEQAVSPAAIRARVYREFRRRHPLAFERMFDVMREKDLGHGWPYLWMLRAYEKWRVIPNCNPISEGWSRAKSPEELLSNWRSAIRVEQRARDRLSKLVGTV